MNEIINRLLPNPFAVDYIGTDEPIDLYTEKEMLEFAELIARDCISVFTAMDHGNPMHGYDEIEDFPKAIHERYNLQVRL